MIQLSHCKEGERRFIGKVSGSGPFKKRLLEMGFMKGVEVYIVKYAPLKDPMEIVIKDFHLSLRVVEAEQIMVD